MNHKKILIVDDDKDIIEILKLYIEKDGYTVVEAYDGKAAYEIVKNGHIDMAVIDIMMPEIDGFQLVKKIRESYNMPIIILSARGGDNDKILGLDLGADDYMAKPFNPLELAARVQAQMRRYYSLNNKTSKENEERDEIKIGSITLNKTSCILFKNGEEVPLTPLEYKIIVLLMEHPGRVYTRAQIFERAWGEYYNNDDNAIMVHISKIREKIEDDPKNPKYLKTLRGLGYRFEKQV